MWVTLNTININGVVPHTLNGINGVGMYIGAMVSTYYYSIRGMYLDTKEGTYQGSPINHRLQPRLFLGAQDRAHVLIECGPSAPNVALLAPKRRAGLSE